MINGARTVANSLQQKIKVRAKQDWNLQNPHLWSDQIIGRDIYELHTRHGAKWRGWQPHQIAFMRDVTDLRFPIVMAICNRGGSKTMLTAYSACCMLDNMINYRLSILSGSKKQASMAYKYCSDVFSLSSMNEKVVGDVTLLKTNLIGGGGAEILAASEKQTKAPRADMVIIDESCSAKSSVINSIWGQLFTAENIKIVMLTTPDDPIHITKKWWDDWEKLGIIRYHWDAYQCAWIPRKNIELMKRIMDEATFRINVLALWTSRSGSVFDYGDIMASLCNTSDLPPLGQIDRFFNGIDWGDAHETVATVVGMRGDPLEGTDEWFVYDQEAWQKDDFNTIIYGEDYDKPNRKRGIIDLAEAYQAETISEQSSAGALGNRRLERELPNRGLHLRKVSFSRQKHKVVGNARMRLEQRRYKIPRRFQKLITQLTNYNYKMIGEEITDEYEKKEDDRVDSFVWGNWGWNPFRGGIESIEGVSEMLK